MALSRRVYWEFLFFVVFAICIYVGALPKKLLVSNPTAVNFAQSVVSSTQTATIKLTNTGSAALKISSAQVSGSEFSISGLNLPMTLAAGKSSIFNVTYSPQVPGTAQGSISVSSNDQNSPLLIPLSGSALSSLQITTSTLSTGQVGGAYQATLSAAGGLSPYVWSVLSGALPPGLVLDGNSGTISGTPTVAGQSSFTAQVVDSENPSQSASATFSINIAGTAKLSVKSNYLEEGVNGVFYSADLLASGGVAPYTWTVVAGSLPPGLSLNSVTGTISGTPTQTGPVTFPIQLTDSASQSAQSTLTLNVLPELPRATVDTGMPTQSGPIIQVNATGDLQAAINVAQCGSTIKLQAGATYQGRFVFPNKGCTASNWILVTTDATSFPAAGTRITPADSSNMPKIVTNQINAAALDFSSQNGNPGGAFYRVVGVEVTLTGAALSTYFDAALVNLGVNESSYSLQPHHIILDRCYIHGTPAGEVRRGVLMNGSNLAVINSNISDIHQTGSDSQAIAGWNGPGPFKIQNNRLEASSENIAFGGAIGGVSDNVSSDIEIRQNYLFKPLTWKQNDPSFAGTAWLVKNLLELKNAQRVLLGGNVFENSWNMGQVGFAVLLTPRGPGSGQGGPSATVSEITFNNNLILHVGGGFNIAADDSNEAAPRPLRGQNIALINNVVLDANALQAGANGPGVVVQLLNGVPNFTLNHNTGFGTQAFVLTSLSTESTTPNRPNAPSVIMSNLFSHGSYGLFCGNMGVGNPALSSCFSPPLYSFAQNLLIALPSGVSPTDYPTTNSTCNSGGATCYPPDLVAAGELDPVNCNAGTFDFTKCALSGTSPYVGAAADGKNIGADINAISAVTAGVRP